MADTDHGELQCEASPESIRAALDRALASLTFRNSDRLSRFLRFVVERTLAGAGEQLKEYSIGIEVFGRPSSYDPRLDPVVRLEARRLRTKLLQYYESEGRDDSVRIEVPKGGYSAVFLAKRALPERPASENKAAKISSPARPVSQAGVRWLRWLVPAAVVIGLALFGLLVARRAPLQKAASDHVASVAVLPFQNLSSNPEDEYFSDGFTDELIGALGRVPGVRVAARASTFHFKGKTENVRSIGEQLNVGSIVEGSIQKNGDDIHITAELIRIADGYRIWTETYTRKTADAQAVENDFSRSIASALTQTLAGMPAAGATRHAADSEAHELYLRGRYWWNRRSIADILKAIHYFNQALEHDPVYAQAYLGLADAYAVMGANEQAPPQEVLPKARAAVEKALQLDDSLSEAHATLAQITFYYDGDSPKAEAEFHKAIALNPSYATAYQWYGLLLLYNRRFDEAVTQFTKAQALDPLSLIITADVGRVYFYAGNYEAARQVAEKMLSYDPDFALAHDSLGQVYAWTGKYKEAIDELQKYYALSGHDPDALVLMAQTHALARQPEQALSLLRQLQDPKSGYISPYSFASIYACLGDRPRTYEWLERAFREHAVGLLALAVDPAFRNFRSEPRFQQLLKKVGHASEQ